jgi:CheY-like chemotaxis protein
MSVAKWPHVSANKILIVDDDIDIRDTLRDFLEDEGYVVGAVANGREALDYLREHPATSLVLLDLMMPIMNGYEFRQAQQRDDAIAAVPVIVMTARGDASDVGVDQILEKPFKLTQLREAIHDVVPITATSASEPT